MNTDYNESSLFNEAMLQITRLHNSWVKCKGFRTHADLYSWRWELENIWSELSIDARRLQDREWIRNEYNIYISVLDKQIDVAYKNNNRVMLYTLLDRKEQYLRLLQDKSGKGGSYRDERRSMLD
jgi:hypothetical protein